MNAAEELSQSASSLASGTIDTLQVSGKRAAEPFEDDGSCKQTANARKHRVRIRKSKRTKIVEKSMATGKKLLVFDLNGVLIHRTSISDYIVRPGAVELLIFLSSRCDLAIWTSAKKETVKRIFRTMFSSSGFDPERFLFVWNQSQCTINEANKTTDDGDFDDRKPSFLKEIAQIRTQYPQFDYDGGCFLIDDSDSKLLRNPPQSGIRLRPFVGDVSDAALLPGGYVYEMLSSLTEKL